MGADAVTDPSLIADLIRAGLSPELVGRVVASLLSRNVPDLSRTFVDTTTEYERLRKAEYRAKTKREAKANDVALLIAPPKNVPDLSRNVPDIVPRDCNLLSSLSSSESEKRKKESTEKEKKERGSVAARGTRLIPGQSITEADWAFAIDAGMTAPAARHAWAEFVDYWVAIPGHRGVKLNWSATWRNRVRELIKRGNVNGRDDKSLIAACDRQIERFGGVEAARAYIPGSSGPTPLRLDFGQVPTGNKLISSR